jgi:chromosomal replication initiation ATPase DnaA
LWDFIKSIKDCIAISGSESKFVSKKYSVNDVIAYVAKHFSVEVDDIVMVKKGHKEKNLPRWFAIKLCQGLTGLNLQALADVFNVEHYSAISKTVGRLNTLMVEDRKVKLQLDKLQDCLMSEVKV